MLTTLKDIYNQANLKCDDNIDARTSLIYLNQGIISLNSFAGLKLPKVENDMLSSTAYIVSEDDYVNETVAAYLIAFIAYSIKQSEGYQNLDNVFYQEYLALRAQFQQKFKYALKQEYILTPAENGSISVAKKSRPFATKMRWW